MGAHARRLHHAPQRLLAPAPARLVGLQHHAELLRLLRQGLALLRQRFELLPHLAQRGGLGRFRLLQPLLVGLQLLLQRLDQRLDRLLPLRPDHPSRPPAACRSFAPPAAKTPARSASDASALSAAERLAQVRQRLLLRVPWPPHRPLVQPLCSATSFSAAPHRLPRPRLRGLRRSSVLPHFASSRSRWSRCCRSSSARPLIAARRPRPGHTASRTQSPALLQSAAAISNSIPSGMGLQGHDHATQLAQ